MSCAVRVLVGLAPHPSRVRGLPAYTVTIDPVRPFLPLTEVRP